MVGEIINGTMQLNAVLYFHGVFIFLFSLYKISNEISNHKLIIVARKIYMCKKIQGLPASIDSCKDTLRCYNKLDSAVLIHYFYRL